MGTAVRLPEVSRPQTEPAAAPAARRVRAPRWLDLRLVLGVLLVLGSVPEEPEIDAAAETGSPG